MKTIDRSRLKTLMVREKGIFARKHPGSADGKACPERLLNIPIEAKFCGHCAQPQAA